jgi:hypothetical protein
MTIAPDKSTEIVVPEGHVKLVIEASKWWRPRVSC